ncbi:hypothetical protein M885DRAFT_522421 [Pelagophyceae sp. CCMP2097]|nr:hypothetical protein M885DRAFT_522421 [Pelagophyceae sp. CCMP2097]|mmetsp:Transcript_3162/g.9573  ORF Transcript_3162/g.9573 Transcript_3162/m.9573 type:complete len:238 (-) Transcript_3162:17-730(-)
MMGGGVMVRKPSGGRNAPLFACESGSLVKNSIDEGIFAHADSSQTIEARYGPAKSPKKPVAALDSKSKAPSGLGTQNEGRYNTRPSHSFYGPVGKARADATKRCAPRTSDPATLSPGPTKYRLTALSLDRDSTRTQRSPISFPQPKKFDPRQLRILNLHRARQVEWPSCGDFDCRDISKRRESKRDPQCNFGSLTTSRPFFEPLDKSTQSEITEKVSRRLTLRRTLSSDLKGAQGDE